MNDREYIIAKARELGVTADEMGFCKMEIPVPDKQLIHEVSQMIIGMDIKEEARENISEKYWEDLAIAKKKYKVVKTTVQKTVYKDIFVAMPEDEDIDRINHYVGSLDNLDTDYPDDEEDWEISDYEVDEDNLTEDEVNRRGEDDIWNYNDFAE